MRDMDLPAGSIVADPASQSVAFELGMGVDCTMIVLLACCRWAELKGLGSCESALLPARGADFVATFALLASRLHLYSPCTSFSVR